MAKFKKVKYPKKPKASASIETKMRYLERCKMIDKENAKREAEKRKSAELSKRIAGMRQK